MDKYEEIIELWHSYSIKSCADLDKYLESFRILFAYNSGRIENETITYNDTREIFQNSKVLNFSGEPRAIFEQQNQKMCYEFLKEKIVSKESLSVNLICEIHRTLTAGTYDERRYVVNSERPGELKKHDYVVGENEVGSGAKEAETDLRELICEVNTFSGGSILKAGAYLHAKFEYIHPFADGNGRVGRTILNYFLMQHNHPPLIIYDEDKMHYYDALKQYDKFEELDTLYIFLEKQTEKTWEKALRLAQGAKKDHKRLDEFL